MNYRSTQRVRRSAVAVGVSLLLGLPHGITTQAFVFTSLLTIPAFNPIGLYLIAVAGAFVGWFGGSTLGGWIVGGTAFARRGEQQPCRFRPPLSYTVRQRSEV